VSDAEGVLRGRAELNGLVLGGRDRTLAHSALVRRELSNIDDVLYLTVW